MHIQHRKRRTKSAKLKLVSTDKKIYNVDLPKSLFMKTCRFVKIVFLCVQSVLCKHCPPSKQMFMMIFCSFFNLRIYTIQMKYICVFQIRMVSLCVRHVTFSTRVEHDQSLISAYKCQTSLGNRTHHLDYIETLSFSNTSALMNQ